MIKLWVRLMVKKTMIQNHKDLFDCVKTQIECKTKKKKQTSKYFRKKMQKNLNIFHFQVIFTIYCVNFIQYFIDSLHFCQISHQAYQETTFLSFYYVRGYQQVLSYCFHQVGIYYTSLRLEDVN